VRLRSALIEGGHTVTQLGPPVAGQIASSLATGSFDQVFFWDDTQVLYLTNQADKDALRDWYRDHGNGMICIDSRSLGLLSSTLPQRFRAAAAGCGSAATTHRPGLTMRMRCLVTSDTGHARASTVLA